MLEVNDPYLGYVPFRGRATLTAVYVFGRSTVD